MTPPPFVVITSVFPPTAAVRAFCGLAGDRLIVVGDRKTPTDWSLPPADYLGPDVQLALGGALARQLPWNHYCRKLLGYLRAIRRGAEVIYDTDDDNLPKADWEIPRFDGAYATTAEDLGFVNVYRSFSDAHIWPRGFPLRAIRDPRTVLGPAQEAVVDAAVGIWQSLADGDPDVDAIYRLVDGRACHFKDRAPLVLGRGTICPFNSQATAVRKPLFPLLYLPGSVTFRFTDILRGLVAQPILWASGYQLGFTRATVVQERNPHDGLRDFESEIPGYLHADVIPGIVGGAVRSGASVSDNLLAAYGSLHRAGIVDQSELPRVEAWIEDIASSR